MKARPRKTGVINFADISAQFHVVAQRSQYYISICVCLSRYRLFLKDTRKGSVLQVESIDRRSRLPVGNWHKLKAAIASKRLRMSRSTCRPPLGDAGH